MVFIIAVICGLVWAFFCVGSMVFLHKIIESKGGGSNLTSDDYDICTVFFFFGIFFGFITFWFILYYWEKQRKEKISSSNIFPEFDEKPYDDSYFADRQKVFEKAIGISDPKDSMILEEAYEYFCDAKIMSDALNVLLTKSFDLSKQVKCKGFLKEG